MDSGQFLIWAVGGGQWSVSHYGHLPLYRKNSEHLSMKLCEVQSRCRRFGDKKISSPCRYSNLIFGGRSAYNLLTMATELARLRQSAIEVYVNKCWDTQFNPLNAELNPICHLLALLGAHHIFHVSGIRVNRQDTGWIRQRQHVGKLLWRETVQCRLHLGCSWNCHSDSCHLLYATVVNVVTSVKV